MIYAETRMRNESRVEPSCVRQLGSDQYMNASLPPDQVPVPAQPLRSFVPKHPWMK